MVFSLAVSVSRSSVRLHSRNFTSALVSPGRARPKSKYSLKNTKGTSYHHSAWRF